MTYDEYINQIISKNLLCDEYKELLLRVGSKKQLFDLLSDCNGVSFFCEMQSRGIDTPYGLIYEYLGKYINGQYKPRHELNENDERCGSYTSAIYVSYANDIVADTTLLSVLNCKCNIIVPKNKMCTMHIDQKSDVTVVVDGFGVNVFVYGDGKVKAIGNKDNIKIVKKR